MPNLAGGIARAIAALAATDYAFFGRAADGTTILETLSGDWTYPGPGVDGNDIVWNGTDPSLTNDTGDVLTVSALVVCWGTGASGILDDEIICVIDHTDEEVADNQELIYTEIVIEFETADF